jgi:hypothetical protein
VPVTAAPSGLACAAADARRVVLCNGKGPDSLVQNMIGI